MDISNTQRLPGGIIERRFTVEGAAGRPVPGVLWTREGAPGGTPLVLLGHGGGGSKDAPGNTARRDYFTGERGIATAAIDAPGHGDLKFTTDFRSVYASVIAQRFGIDPTAILGAGYPTLPLFT